MWDRLSKADQQAKWNFIADVLQASSPTQKLDWLLLNNQSQMQFQAMSAGVIIC